jgi:ABC-type polysaccharide/polyol phosphate export permease
VSADALASPASSARLRKRMTTQRRILLSLVEYQVRKAHAGSVFGIAWMVIQPLLYLVTYFVLLTVLRAHADERQAIVIMAGLVPWLFFTRSLNNAFASLSANAQFFNQINFPIGVLPFVSVGVAFVEFVVGVALLIVITATFGTLGLAALLILPSAGLMCIFLVALASLAAPLGVMLPDVRSVVPPLLRIGLFLSPVLYLPSLVPSGLSFLPYLNPMAYFISLFRAAVLDETDVYVISFASDLAVATAVTVITVVVAVANRHYVRRTVVDHL